MTMDQMYKSQLHELVQKKSWPAPQYECVKEGPSHHPRFKATVEVNGVKYESDPGYNTLKAAEHAAAKRALEAIGATTTGSQQSVQNSGLLKNVLQEYAQKYGFPLPVYKSVRSGSEHSPSYTTTVEIGGYFYSGGAAKNKKEAEIKAARTAMIAIEALQITPAVDPSLVKPGTQNNNANTATNNNVSNLINNLNNNKSKKRPRPKDGAQEGTVKREKNNNGTSNANAAANTSSPPVNAVTNATTPTVSVKNKDANQTTPPVNVKQEVLYPPGVAPIYPPPPPAADIRYPPPGVDIRCPPPAHIVYPPAERMYPPAAVGILPPPYMYPPHPQYACPPPPYIHAPPPPPPYVHPHPVVPRPHMPHPPVVQ